MLVGALAGSDETTSDLYEIDSSDAGTTSLGPIGRAITGLAFDPTDGTLYAVSSPNSDIEPRCLFTLDPATGAATLVGPLLVGATPAVCADIAFDASGQLWAFVAQTTRRLATLDKTTGALTLLGVSGMTGSNCGYGMDFDEAGVLYCLGGGTGGNYYTLNLTTGARTSVGTIDPDDLTVFGCIGGASYDSTTMWALCSQSQSELFTVDLATGVATSVGLLTPHPGMWDALAFLAGEGPGPEPEPGAPGRFAESPPWRFLVTNRDSETLTFLDRLASNRTLTRTLNEPLSIEFSVPSDHPEVNLVLGDGDPYVDEGKRFLYAFRRENPDEGSLAANWICRGAGLILDVTDRGDANVGMSDVIALDPWALLYRRPCLNMDLELPDEGGLLFEGSIWPGSTIALELMLRTATAHGETHIDWTSGTIEETEPVELDLQQGTSVGEAWDALIETGTMDIVLEPVYDPVGRPGILAEFNVFEKAGAIRRNAIFAWDKPSRSAVTITHEQDGRERANKVQFYIGQGGPPVALQTNAAAVTEYGQYWEQQFFPAHESQVTVEGFASKHLAVRQNGLMVYTLSPAPERSPSPFLDYDIGDDVPLYASNRLREALTTLKRVISIPLAIGDDQLEAPVEIVLADAEHG